MKQTAVKNQEWLKILGKGMVTIPKGWREELGLVQGEVVKAQKIGSKVIIEAKEEPVAYRTFSDQEINEWLREDKLPKSLATKIDKKLTFPK